MAVVAYRKRKRGVRQGGVTKYARLAYNTVVPRPMRSTLSAAGNVPLLLKSPGEWYRQGASSARGVDRWVKSKFGSKWGGVPRRKRISGGKIPAGGGGPPRMLNQISLQRAAHFTGTRMGRMVRGRKIHKVSKTRFKGVVIEHDAHNNVSGGRTVYFGHYTHPSKSCMNVIGYALAKYFGGVACGDVPTSLENGIGQDNATTTESGFRLLMYYRSSPESTTVSNTSFTVTNGMTYATFGQDRDWETHSLSSWHCLDQYHSPN